MEKKNRGFHFKSNISFFKHEREWLTDKLRQKKTTLAFTQSRYNNFYQPPHPLHSQNPSLELTLSSNSLLETGQIIEERTLFIPNDAL